MPVKKTTKAKATKPTKKPTIPAYNSKLEDQLYEKAIQGAYATQSEIYGSEGLLYDNYRDYKFFDEMLRKLDMTVIADTEVGVYEAHLLFVATRKPHRRGYHQDSLVFKYNLRHTKEGQSEAKIVLEVIGPDSVSDAIEEIASMLSCAVAEAYKSDYIKTYGYPEVVLN